MFASIRPGGLVDVRGMFIRLARSAIVWDPTLLGVSEENIVVWTPKFNCLMSNRAIKFGGDNDFVLPDLEVLYLDREHEFVDARYS